MLGYSLGPTLDLGFVCSVGLKVKASHLAANVAFAQSEAQFWP